MRSLEETLGQVKQRILRARSRRPVNEQNTKAALVEPILRALGWNPEDLEEVEREFKVKRRDKPVDYALLVLRTPRLFIEAKALGQNLDDRRWANQIMGYAAVAGVQWVVLTDGNEYRIFNSHATVAIDKKLFRKIRIVDEGSLVVETLGLLSKQQLTENRIDVLWKAYFVDRQVGSAIEELFAEPGSSLVRLVRKQTGDLSPKEIRASLGRAELHLDFPVKTMPGPTSRQRRNGKKTAIAKKKAHVGVSLKQLIEAGLIQPPLALEVEYKGHHLKGKIERDGHVSHGGKKYRSSSAAAGMARLGIIGASPGRKFPQTNGWTFWKYRDEAGQLKELDFLRQRYLRKKKA